MANFNMGDIDLGSEANIDGFLSSNTNEPTAFVTSTILQSIGPGNVTPFELETFQPQGATGIDALFEQHPQLVQARRQMVASMGDLKPFMRISAETLIHKSTTDLWALKKEADGKFYIERLFDDNGEPIKG